MPKKPRQAHIPNQQPARRRTRRDLAASAMPVAESSPLEEVVAVSTQAAGPVTARPRRRLDLVQGRLDSAAPRTVAGQLPTYEHSYLVRELRSTGLISASLLATIILLTILLR